MSSNSTNGESKAPANGASGVDLRDTIVVQTPEGAEIEFEVVGLVEDESQVGYAVCYNEKEDQFVVTDATGQLLADAQLAQEILDDFFVLADEEEDDGGEGKP